MSKAWPMVPLGEVLTERQEVPSVEALAKGDVRIVGKIGFNDGKIHLRNGSETKTDMILVRPGDLLISGINVAKGAIAIYGEENADSIAATIHYGAYIPKKDRVDVKYLWWLLRSKIFRDLLDGYVPGGIKTELKAKRLLPIPVPLPSLEEQRQIIKRIKELNARLEEARSYKVASTLDLGNFFEACIGDVMDNFMHLGRFEEVIFLKPRSGPSFPTHPDWTGTPVLMPSAVTGFGVNITRLEFGMGNEVISDLDRLQPNDIIIARGNKKRQVGNAGVVPREAKGYVCANLLMRLKVDTNRTDPFFCVYWLRSPRMRSHVEQNMTGTNPNIQKINQTIILNYPFPTKASLSEQYQVVAYLDGLQAKERVLKKQQAETVAELEALLPSILDKAFKGEL
jgi:type I restriction enzyme S subunit